MRKTRYKRRRQSGTMLMETSFVDEKSRILLVDDDDGLRSLIAEFLAGHGYNVLQADGGQAARRILEREKVNVAVLDVMMPGEDGLSLARSLSGRLDLGIIMVSALGSETDRIVGLEVGADDYLAKPVSPRELLARIRALLRRQHQVEEADEVATAYMFDGWTFDVLRRVLRDPLGVITS